MGNIFDEAGRSSKSKTSKAKSSPAQKIQPPSSANPTKYTQADADVHNMFEKIKELKNDIDHQVRILYDEGQRRNINIDNFLKAYVPPPDVENEYKKIKEIEQKLASNAVKITSKSTPAKSDDKLSSERKSKTRGSRQKWIPMP